AQSFRGEAQHVRRHVTADPAAAMRRQFLSYATDAAADLEHNIFGSDPDSFPQPFVRLSPAYDQILFPFCSDNVHFRTRHCFGEICPDSFVIAALQTWRRLEGI